MTARLDLAAIDASLRAVQRDFDRVNRTLRSPRDPLTDEVLVNMMSGYRLVDEALADGVDPFRLGNSEWLLELNARVLCGTDEAKRREYAPHIAMTAQDFYAQEGGGIGGLVEWLQRHAGEDVWNRAAGTYIQILSRPQLYIEGNHRAGSLIMSYLLAREGEPPFVLSRANARAYFEPSLLAKETRRNGLDGLTEVPRLKRAVARLLERTSDSRHLLLVAHSGRYQSSRE